MIRLSFCFFWIQILIIIMLIIISVKRKKYEDSSDTNIVFRDLQLTDTFRSTLLPEKNWSKDYINTIFSGFFYYLTKKMNFCHKLKFSNPNIFSTWLRKPLILQTQTIRSNRMYIKGLQHRVATVKELKISSLWPKLISIGTEYIAYDRLFIMKFIKTRNSGRFEPFFLGF